MSSEASAHLARGKACVPCRRRKMKCDGNQPVCNQCTRFNRQAECQYSEGPSPSTTRVLEQHITRLQSRIQELEQDDPSLVRLHDPYRNYREAERSGSAAPSSQGAQLNWWETPDPPAQIQQTLVQHFLQSASKFGFFLDTTRFVNSFAAPTPAHPRGPPSVLRNVVYLFGINLSQNPQYTVRESVFLGRTLRSVHVALSTAQERQHNALYILQAEVLLAYYFCHCDRLTDAKFHASAAVSLAIMCNLHKLMSTSPQGGQRFQHASQAYMPQPVDHIDEAERIYAWWTTFILDKSWVVGQAAPAMINETQEASTVIDTPWPLAVEKYAQRPASARPNVGSTVQRFLTDVQADGDAVSPLALVAKASALYDRANYLASYLNSSTADYEGALLALDNALERFKSSLPPLERAGPQPAEDTAHNLLLIHALCHAATIQLHRSFVARSSTSMTRCLTSANTIVRVAQDLTRHVRVVNPVIGVLAATAGEVLMHGLRSLQTSRTAWASSSALPGEERFVQSVRDLAAAMQRLTQSPFIAAQTAKFREASNSM